MQRRIKRMKRRGFTIVELSLAIAFIGVLSIIVVLVISNAISAYHRGLTLNQINTVGMDLVEDMRRAIQSSPGILPKDLCRSGIESLDYSKRCEENGGDSLLYFVRYIGKDKVMINGKRLEGAGNTVPIYGAFCTGKYSYLWNSGYLFNSEVDGNQSGGLLEEYGLKLKGKIGNNVINEENFRLIKIKDEKRAICKAASKYNNGYLTREELRGGSGVGYNNNTINLEETWGVGMDQVERLLGGDDANKRGEEQQRENTKGGGNLAIYDLTVDDPAKGLNTYSVFYSVSFILGTVQGGIDIMKSGDYCKAPEEYDENFDYCAINKFNFAAQANGG